MVRNDISAQKKSRLLLVRLVLLILQLLVVLLLLLLVILTVTSSEMFVSPHVSTENLDMKFGQPVPRKEAVPACGRHGHTTMHSASIPAAGRRASRVRA